MRLEKLAAKVEQVLACEFPELHPSRRTRAAARRCGLSYDLVWKMRAGESVSESTILQFANEFDPENVRDWLAIKHRALLPVEIQDIGRTEEVREPQTVELRIRGALRDGVVFTVEGESTTLRLGAEMLREKRSPWVIVVERNTLAPLLVTGDKLIVAEDTPTENALVVVRRQRQNLLAWFRGMSKGRPVVQPLVPAGSGPNAAVQADKIVGVVLYHLRDHEVLKRFAQ